MDISVVINTWNRKDRLRRALNSILNQTYKGKIGIIVVDNHSTDSTVDMIRENFPFVSLIVLPNSNYDFAEARNIGASTASGDMIIVMDDDAVLKEDWIEKMIKRFEENLAAGAFTSRIITYHQKGSYYAKGKEVEIWDFKGENNTERYNICWFHGAGTAFRKDVLEKAGYFPDEIARCGDEGDLSARIYLNGWKIEYNPDIITYHYPSGKPDEWKHIYYGLRNLIWTHFKYMSIKGFLRYLCWGLLDYFKVAAHNGYYYAYLKGILHGFAGIPKNLKKRRPCKEWEELKITQESGQC